MKKILLIAVAAMALSTASFGATFTTICTNNANSADGGGNKVPADFISCASFNALPGFQITGVTLDLVTSFNGNVGSTPGSGDGTLSLNVNYNPTIGTPDSTNCNVSGTGITGSNTCLAAFSDAPLAPGTTFYNAFTVAVSFSTPTQDAGSNTWAGAATANVYVNYTYEAIPTVEGEVPEPTTVGLIGAGLVGLAAAARRRR